MAESEPLLLEEVFESAIDGEPAIKNWLEQGGDPDQGLAQVFHGTDVTFARGSTLLMVAACMGRLDLVRLLVDHGADVNVTCTAGQHSPGWTALMWAVSSRSADCVEFLLDRGANTSGIVDGPRIIYYEIHLEKPRIVRMLLAAGVALTTARFDGVFNNRTLEELANAEAAHCRQYVADREPDQGAMRQWLQTMTERGDRYAESASILAGTRLAGHSYKRWVLKDYMALLRLRSLLARKRARAGPETTLVVWRLFDTSTAAGVPDPCFWKVVEYAWLGNWRRP